ncbi:unnamed protein product [Brassica oleracea]
MYLKKLSWPSNSKRRLMLPRVQEELSCRQDWYCQDREKS